MSLESKYGLSKSQIQNLYENGKLASTAYQAEKVWQMYKSKEGSGLTHTEIILFISDETKYSDSWVRRLLKEANE